MYRQAAPYRSVLVVERVVVVPPNGSVSFSRGHRVVRNAFPVRILLGDSLPLASMLLLVVDAR